MYFVHFVSVFFEAKCNLIIFFTCIMPFPLCLTDFSFYSAITFLSLLLYLQLYISYALCPFSLRVNVGKFIVFFFHLYHAFFLLYVSLISPSIAPLFLFLYSYLLLFLIFFLACFLFSSCFKTMYKK